MLVRTWNLFHGNAVPPERSAYLDEMVRLAAADRPDVLCLQEVPAWALGRLAAWSGMHESGAVAQRPGLGPLPSHALVGRALTALHHGLLRSAFTGQANATLVGPGLRILARWTLTLNPRAFRDAQARWLGLGVLARLAWAKERRVCHAVRLALPDRRRATVGNLHATSYPADRRLADAEVLRAAAFVDAVAEPGDVCVLAGDFNVRPGGSQTLRDLQREWGYSAPAFGIDHVLVRGASAAPPERWPPERRRDGWRLLSDHAPVEVTIA